MEVLQNAILVMLYALLWLKTSGGNTLLRVNSLSINNDFLKIACTRVSTSMILKPLALGLVLHSLQTASPIVLYARMSDAVLLVLQMSKPGFREAKSFKVIKIAKVRADIHMC